MDSPHHNFVPQGTLQMLRGYPVFQAWLTDIYCSAGGQVLSAIVGCAIRLALQDVLWVSAALGMSLALVVMMLTKTVHPPGNLLAHSP